jgi:hypothetical protein
MASRRRYPRDPEASLAVATLGRLDPPVEAPTFTLNDRQLELKAKRQNQGSDKAPFTTRSNVTYEQDDVEANRSTTSSALPPPSSIRESASSEEKKKRSWTKALYKSSSSNTRSDASGATSTNADDQKAFLRQMLQKANSSLPSEDNSVGQKALLRKVLARTMAGKSLSSSSSVKQKSEKKTPQSAATQFRERLRKHTMNGSVVSASVSDKYSQDNSELESESIGDENTPEVKRNVDKMSMREKLNRIRQHDEMRHSKASKDDLKYDSTIAKVSVTVPLANQSIPPGRGNPQVRDRLNERLRQKMFKTDIKNDPTLKNAAALDPKSNKGLEGYEEFFSILHTEAFGQHTQVRLKMLDHMWYHTVFVYLIDSAALVKFSSSV